MRIKKSISLFFLLCLLNVAFIPQLCVSAVQSFNNELSTDAHSQDRNADVGINIFEEESKEGQEENKTGAEGTVKIIKNNSNYTCSGFIHLINLKAQNKLYLDNYCSIKLTPLSPPPDQI